MSDQEIACHRPNQGESYEDLLQVDGLFRV